MRAFQVMMDVIDRPHFIDIFLHLTGVVIPLQKGPRKDLHGWVSLRGSSEVRHFTPSSIKSKGLKLSSSTLSRRTELPRKESTVTLKTCVRSLISNRH